MRKGLMLVVFPNKLRDGLTGAAKDKPFAVGITCSGMELGLEGKNPMSPLPIFVVFPRLFPLKSGSEAVGFPNKLNDEDVD
jgi:hypothetical protein